MRVLELANEAPEQRVGDSRMARGPQWPRRTQRCVLLAFTTALLVAPRALSQDIKMGAPSIEVRATPEKLLPREEVTLSGTTAIGKTRTVSISVAPPLKSPSVDLSASADEGGNFSVSFRQTDVPGRYTVLARSPVGSASVTTYFTVARYAAFLEDISKELSRDKNESRQALDQAEDELKHVPDSPAKRQLPPKLQKARRSHDEMNHHWKDVEEVLARLRAMLDKAPSTSDPFKKTFRDFRRWERESEEQHPKNPFTQKRLASCDSLDQIVEGIAFASLLMDFVGKGLEILNNVLYDVYVPDALGKLGVEETGKLAITEFLKVCAGGARFRDSRADAVRAGVKVVSEAEGTFVDILTDVVQFGFQTLFNQYCERFRGPFKATMNATFSKEAEPWWKYGVVLEGTLDLRYPKDAPADAPIPMSGEFLGTATRFTVWENALSVLYPKSMKGTLLFRTVRPPAGTPYNVGPLDLVKLGKVAVNALPKSFHIPVTGEYAHSKIKVQFGPAISDFDANARVVYVMMPVYMIGFPVVSAADLPYKNAHFLLMRATGNGPIDLPVQVGEKVSLATTKMTNDSGRKGSAEAEYTLEIKVCNPDCP